MSIQPTVTLLHNNSYVNAARVHNHPVFAWLHLSCERKWKNGEKSYFICVHKLDGTAHQKECIDYDDAIENFRTSLHMICALTLQEGGDYGYNSVVHAAQYDTRGNAWSVVEDLKEMRYHVWQSCISMERMECKVVFSSTRLNFAMLRMNALIEQSIKN